MKSNGFGSLQQLIAVLIHNKHAPKFLNIEGVKLLEQREKQSLMQYPLWTTRPDDDEILVYELRFRFSSLGIPFEDWSIDWEKSSY
jgi:hypothetical protein